jgi:hypothetical protein
MQGVGLGVPLLAEERPYKEGIVMERKSMQRAAVLAIVISLALAGARPAAAGSLSFLDRLGSFWPALHREPGAAPAARRAAASHAGTRARQAKAAPQTTTDNPDQACLERSQV